MRRILHCIRLIFISFPFSSKKVTGKIKGRRAPNQHLRETLFGPAYSGTTERRNRAIIRKYFLNIAHSSLILRLSPQTADMFLTLRYLNHTGIPIAATNHKEAP